MRRRLFNVAVTVSLALFVATVALWGRGRLTWNYDRISFNSKIRDNGGQTSLGVTSSPFGIDFDHVRISAMAQASPGWTFRSSRSTVADTDTVAETYESLGGHWIAGAWWAAVVTPGWSYHLILVPHWHLVVLTSVLPLIGLVAKLRAHRRRRSGACPTCGYDLRATPDRCPECGDSGAAADVARPDRATV